MCTPDPRRSMIIVYQLAVDSGRAVVLTIQDARASDAAPSWRAQRTAG